MRYVDYNREERALCAHLFRLLHERLSKSPPESGLARFLSLIKAKPDVLPQPTSLQWKNIGIYSEVALIRDAYCARKPPKDGSLDALYVFMDNLVRLVAAQEGKADCRPYSKLPPDLRNPRKTHPKHIAYKARELLTDPERRVYGAIQAMFNAKPDLAITVDGWLIVVEAKFTEAFDADQLTRTQNIADVWKQLLYADLGFSAPPEVRLVGLGLDAAKPGIPFVSWESVAKMAAEFFEEDDLSLTAFRKALALGKVLPMRCDPETTESTEDRDP